VLPQRLKPRSLWGRGYAALEAPLFYVTACIRKVQNKIKGQGQRTGASALHEHTRGGRQTADSSCLAALARRNDKVGLAALARRNDKVGLAALARRNDKGARVDDASGFAWASEWTRDKRSKSPPCAKNAQGWGIRFFPNTSLRFYWAHVYWAHPVVNAVRALATAVREQS
jgi:hypothetical protein